MTAVPAAYGTGVQLICDGCGTTADTVGGGMHDTEVVYVAVTAVGWTGSAFARGPHRCARCAAAPVPRQRPVRRAAGETADRLAVEMMSSVAVVRVSGDIDLDVADDLRSTLETAIGVSPSVVVDLSRAGIIDSTGLGALVRARNAARHRGGELILAGPSRFVQTVLRTMRLHTAFRMFPSVSQAVAAASGQTLVRVCAGRAAS